MNELLYLRHVENWGLPNMPDVRRISTKLGCIDTTTDVTELHVQLLLRGITATIEATEYHDRYSTLQPVGRIELFGDGHTDTAQHRLRDRGIVLFDLNMRPLVHVTEALIGYGGSGPGLTEAIFREVGVDPNVFEEIQTNHWEILSTNIPYHVVVQRVETGENQYEWQWMSVVLSTRH